MDHALPRYSAYMAHEQLHKSVVDKDGKLCFVTIGATAGFDSLIRAVLSETFIHELEAQGYTDLLIQHGNDESGVYRKFQDALRVGSRKIGRLNIRGFSFNVAGLGQEMRAAKGGMDGKEGVVISHAGMEKIYS